MKTVPEISKAQVEVWEWKEKASLKLNKLKADERIACIVNSTKHLVDRIKKAKEKNSAVIGNQ
jgi:malonyl CoA-acyl carrier protein transacylase